MRVKTQRELQKQTEELKVRDTKLDTFVLIVAMVTESCMVLFCMYISIC